MKNKAEFERVTEKVARQLAHMGKLRNEGFWEQYLMIAYDIVYSDEVKTEELMKAYDERVSRRRKK